MAAPDLRASTADLCRAYLASGDRRLRNEVVERHLHLAEAYARRFARSPGTSHEDLRQVALLAMVRAVDRFDPDLDVGFATFVGRTIEGELKRYLRDRTWAVRPPRRAQELHLAVRRAEEHLLQSLGRSPTVPELAEAVAADVDAVLEALEVAGARRAENVEPAGSHEDGRSGTAAGAALAVDGGFGGLLDRVTLAGMVRHLSERDRELLGMSFVLGMSQTEIAAKVGVSQSYLSRVLRRALEQLRQLAHEEA